MPCPVHAHTHASNQRLTHKDLGPREERIIREMLDEFAGVLRPWHDDILAVLESGTVDLRRPQAIKGKIRRALNPYQEEWDTVVQAMWEDGHDVGREIAIQRHALDISFDLTRPEVEQALRNNAFVASQATKDRMVGDIGDALAEAYQEGLGIPDIRNRLQDDVFEDMRNYEAERIARTETISGSNKGAHEAYVDSGAVGEEWLAASDSRTRPSHRAANGQVVGVRDKFVVGGYRAEYPGDPILPTEERVNCRCAVAPVVDPDRLSA